MAFSYKFARPALTVDCVVFRYAHDQLMTALVRRGREPFKGRWALPGGFIGVDEPLDKAALRELYEETGISKAHLEQFFAFDDPRRDPRERVITVAHLALVRPEQEELAAGSDAQAVAWFGVDQRVSLAFDHRKVLRRALVQLKDRVCHSAAGFYLLPEKFSFSQLQGLHEAVRGVGLDKRNFRRKVMRMGILRELKEVEPNVRHRAARLYRFDDRVFLQRDEDGSGCEF